MASPLGEMFDHGTCQIYPLDMLVRSMYRLRRHQYNSEIDSAEDLMISLICRPSTQLEVILAARALNLGRSWWTVASQIVTLANFYLTTWEEYHTGYFVSLNSWI